jgi:Glycosyltransferase family 87
VIASLIWVVAVGVGFIHGGGDAHAYWANRPPDPYAVRPYGAFDGFYYSPAFAQLLYVPTALPWTTFLALWTGVLLLAVYAMVGPWALPVMLFLPIPFEIYFANVSLLIAAAVVFGFRYPALWALPILTKVTPGVGVLWFAFRAEWRSLAIAIATTTAIVGVSALLAPGLWQEWIGVLLGNQAAPGGLEVLPLYVRLPLAVAILWVAARTDRSWLVPIVVLLAMPRIWPASLSVLIAVPALLLRPPDLVPHRSTASLLPRLPRLHRAVASGPGVDPR